MAVKSDLPRVTVLLLTLAAFVVLVAAMRAARSIVVPFLLATFITVIITPFFFGLQKRGVPSIVALLILILILVVAGLFLAELVRQSALQFGENQAVYQDRLQEQYDAVVGWAQKIEDWLRDRGIGRDDDVPPTAEETSGGELPGDETARLDSDGDRPTGTGLVGSATETVSHTDEPGAMDLSEYLNPGSVMRFFSTTLNAFSSVLSNTLLILLIVIFMLFEAAILPRKVRSLPGLKEETWTGLNETVESIRHYMALKTMVSLLTGFLIYIFLLILGVDFPLLLALLAFLLNFVPNVGSFIAGIPGVILALIEFGMGTAIITAIGYVAINTLVGNVLEPRIMGRGLGLSPLIILISLLFWGWVLGPVGMLLSVPLTAAVRLALDSADETRWIAILMGSGPDKPKSPARIRKKAAKV